MQHLEIHYEEAGFVTAHQENRYVLHQQVYDILSNHRHMERRNFIFGSEILACHPDAVLVTVRAAKLPPHIRAIPRHLSIAQGQELRIRCTVAAFKRQGRGALHPNFPVWIKRHEQLDWFAGLAARHGMTVLDAAEVHWSVHTIVAQDKSDRIPAATFVARVRIEDTLAFSQAWLSGIGRCKGYGYGLLELVEEASNVRS